MADEAFWNGVTFLAWACLAAALIGIVMGIVESFKDGE